MLNRLEKWADRILSIKERKLVLLVVSILGGIILLGTAWEKSAPFVGLFQRASSDAGEIAKIKKDVEQQRDLIAAVARDATTARNQMDEAVRLSSDAKRKSDAATGSLKKTGEELDTVRKRSEFSLLLARANADERKAFDELIDAADNE